MFAFQTFSTLLSGDEKVIKYQKSLNIVCNVYNTYRRYEGRSVNSATNIKTKLLLMSNYKKYMPKRICKHGLSNLKESSLNFLERGIPFCSSVPVMLFDTPGISRCRSLHVVSVLIFVSS